MKRSIYPFPYKLSITSNINDGTFFYVPTFCKTNYRTKRCKDFYNKECTTLGIKKCPYGFAVDVREINGTRIIFTCLNVKGISDRKLIQKRLTNKDFNIRIPYERYEESIKNLQSFIEDSYEFYNNKNSQVILKDDYLEKIEVLDNTFHELRKLNQQLKVQAEHLIYSTNNFEWNQVEEIKKFSQTIFSTSQLISIRLNTYDFGVNPNLSLYQERSPIKVHKKFLKVAHCLREYALNKQIKIQLIGESYSAIMANDILELLPYLLLDNAIKYSLIGRTIDVNFKEINNDLHVQIKSFSLRPHENELNRLVNRGVRSSRIESNIQGQGVGLYLANYICELHNIDMSFKLGKERYFDNALPYSDFVVTLIFHDVIKETSLEDTFDLE